MDYDAENFFIDVRNIILSKHMRAEVNRENADNLVEETLEKERYDDLCQIFMAKGTTGKARIIFEDEEGVLCQYYPKYETLVEIVLPESLRSRFVHLHPLSTLVGHLSQTKMHRRLVRPFFWTQMSAYFDAKVRYRTSCSKIGRVS